MTDAKLPKSAVKYIRSLDAQRGQPRCSQCKNYRPNQRCSAVAGVVRQFDRCKLFSRKGD